MTLLRGAVSADLDALVGLEQAAFGPLAWSSALVQAELEGEGTRTAVVAVAAAQLVGYAVLRYAGGTGDVVRVAVAPAARRRGVGRALTVELLGRASSFGCDEVLLEVSADNTAATSLYEGLGFAEIARRPRYYGDGSDALVLRLPLQTKAPPTPPRGQKAPGFRGVSGGNCPLGGASEASRTPTTAPRTGRLPS